MVSTSKIYIYDSNDVNYRLKGTLCKLQEVRVQARCQEKKLAKVFEEASERKKKGGGL